MDKKELQRRAGITEQTEDIQIKEVADLMTQFVMGDAPGAVQKLQRYRDGILGFGRLGANPEEYNRVFKKIYQNFLYNLTLAKEYSDESGK
jgi:hypothetical protein